MGKILLIGDINKALDDASNAHSPSFEIHSNFIDGIEAAGQNSFSAIAVILSDKWSALNSSLKALKDVALDTKIVLLAQMSEEARAKKLIGSGLNGDSLISDYLIYPLNTTKLLRSLSPEIKPHVDVTVESLKLDHEVSQKILQLEKLATTDELTGLKNRRYIWEFANQIIEREKKGNGRVTLLMFDIDNFKHYNDVYGHGAGDEILKQAAMLIKRSCRPHDVVGRIGGDEFVVIFWDDSKVRLKAADEDRRSTMADHPKEAIFIAKRFRAELEKTEFPMLGREGRGVLTISGGLASFPRDGDSIESLVGQADKALLEAKRSGKNMIYLVGTPSDIDNIE